MSRVILNLELAREIELAEAQAAVGCAEAMKSLQQESVGAFQSIAGGYAIYCGPGNPVTQAVGLGLCGPVTAEEFDRLEAFYFERNEPVRVETCPLADASLFAHYRERGYGVTEFSNVMVRAVGDEARTWPATPANIEIWKAGANEIELWVLTVCQGFSEHYPVTEELLRVMKMVCDGERDGVLPGQYRWARRGRRDFGSARPDCGFVWSQHVDGVSRAWGADGVVARTVAESAGVGVRVGDELGAAGEPFAA